MSSVRPDCASPACGHPWQVHAPAPGAGAGRCRINKCPCDQYVAEAPTVVVADTAGIFEKAATMLGEGRIVVLVPAPPEELPAVSLALLRAFLGIPLEDDPRVALVTVQ